MKKKHKILAFLLPPYVLVSSGMVWILIGLSSQVSENQSWQTLNAEKALLEVRLAEIVDQVPFLLLAFFAASLLLVALFFADYMKKKWVIVGYVLLTMIAFASGTYTSLVVDKRSNIRSCHVHNNPLHTEFVPIRYGYPLPRGTTNDMLPQMYLAAQESTFPHFKKYFNGGCTVNTPIWARISYCPKCSAAEEKWRSENR